MPAIIISQREVDTVEYNAQSNASKILVFTGLCAGFALLSVSLRFYVRKCMLRYLGADDVVMGLAMICGILVYVCFVVETHHGLGRHLITISMVDLQNFAHWTFYDSLLMFAGIAFAKISICLLLIRLVKHRGYVYFLWALLTLLAIYNAACILVTVFSCTPTRALWTFTLRFSARCFNVETYLVLGAINAGINIASSVLLATLPIPAILGLKLSWRTKLGLSLVMLLGFFAVGASAVRLKTILASKHSTDQTFNNIYHVWTAVELYFVILAASLPTLKPLFTKIFTKARNQSNNSDSKYRTGAGHALYVNGGYNPTFKHSTLLSRSSSITATPEIPPSLHKEGSNYFELVQRPKTAETIEKVPAVNYLTPISTNTSGRSDSLFPVIPEDAFGAYILRTTVVSTTPEMPTQPLPKNERRSVSVSLGVKTTLTMTEHKDPRGTNFLRAVRKQASRDWEVTIMKTATHFHDTAPEGNGNNDADDKP